MMKPFILLYTSTDHRILLIQNSFDEHNQFVVDNLERIHYFTVLFGLLESRG